MPSTLPFEIKQGDKTIITPDLVKIGRILVKRSGKVVMRIEKRGAGHQDRLGAGTKGKNYIDLEINKGINPTFFQEITCLKSNSVQNQKSS